MEYAQHQSKKVRICDQVPQKLAQDTLSSWKDTQARRPMSVATEFVDTEWDVEFISDPEDNSPRVSLQSSGQPSFTTVSSYDEISTPRSSGCREEYLDDVFRQVEGPRGPHLFHGLTDSLLVDDEYVLTLSPLTPKTNCGIEDLVDEPPLAPNGSPFQYTNADLDSSKLASWSPEMVAQSMLNAGIESSVADSFIENDISGTILVTLKFEDLRELGIPSFGVRTNIWQQIQTLCDGQSCSLLPTAPVESAPSRGALKETRKNSGKEVGTWPIGRRRPRRHILAANDIYRPMKSVSIIGIEQVIPKPHHCSKGEACSTWKRQQKVIEEVKRLDPTIDVKNGGIFTIYGDAGNPETAKAIDPFEIFRPVSDAVPSVVASPDVLRPGGLPPLQCLEEASTRNLSSEGSQDNVRQFLNFQQQSAAKSVHVPPTPPFELAPPSKPAHKGLSRLPKLSIPGHPQRHRPTPLEVSIIPQSAEGQLQQSGPTQSPANSARQPEELDGSAPYRMDKLAPLSPGLENLQNPYRFGTPFSDMDIPVTTVPVGPVARNVSQSVPPDMNYRAASGSNPLPHAGARSRSFDHQTSVSVLPAVDENNPARQLSRTPSPKRPSPVRRVQQQQQQPLQPPPRFKYPWSQPDRTSFERAIPPQSPLSPDQAFGTPEVQSGVTFQGPMKKRKTRLLRNEWHDGYFTLKGTRLNMHKDVKQMDHTLEYIDIDDYAIACSSIASSSKLSAAFKAVHICHGRKKSDPAGAFSFQLIPQDKNVIARLRKRDSSMSGMSGTSPSEGVNGTGKTHHFAVRDRDERIDWMRELMLAKAMKQKGEGFEISVNGNMI